MGYKFGYMLEQLVYPALPARVTMRPVESISREDFERRTLRD